MAQAVFSKRRIRPVHAVLLGVACAAVALPLSRNIDPAKPIAEARPGTVQSIRPIDRMLRGEALGSRRLTPVIAAPIRIAALGPTPRMVLPALLAAPRTDTSPGPDFSILSAETLLPPAPFLSVAVLRTPHVHIGVPAFVKVTDPGRMPEPRLKPTRPVTIVAISVEPEPVAPPANIPEVEIAALPEVMEEAFAPPPPPPMPAAQEEPREAAPRIAIVVTAVGLHAATTRQAIKMLPDAVTLAFAPIGDDTATLAKAASADGHTIFAEIPMEPVNPLRDPGEPMTLRVGHTGADNVARLGKALARVPGATGISSYLGAKFSRSEVAVTPVIGEVAARGLFLFENQPGAQSRLGPLARARNVPYVAVPLALDGDRNEARMRQRLSALEERARREGVAIGVATAYRESVTILDQWIDEAQRRGIEFVPVTRMGETG